MQQHNVTLMQCHVQCLVKGQDFNEMTVKHIFVISANIFCQQCHGYYLISDFRFLFLLILPAFSLKNLRFLNIHFFKLSNLSVARTYFG